MKDNVFIAVAITAASLAGAAIIELTQQMKREQEEIDKLFADTLAMANENNRKLEELCQELERVNRATGKRLAGLNQANKQIV